MSAFERFVERGVGEANVGIRVLAEPEQAWERARDRGCACCSCQPALADTLESALAYAYANNPQLNSQRAVVRATDEGVPTALAGYRPRAVVTANVGMQSLSTTIREIGSTTALGLRRRATSPRAASTPRTASAPRSRRTC